MLLQNKFSEKLVHKNYGSDRTTLLRLYWTLICSVMNYESPGYGFANLSRLNYLDIMDVVIQDCESNPSLCFSSPIKTINKSNEIK